jgi:uncharacterized protein (DUF2267 family)
MASRESAEEAARATLRTLAERLAGGEPHALASQLPEELAEHVRYDEKQKSDPFSLEEFFRRVAEKEGADEPDAAYHARVVMEVLQEAVTKGRSTTSARSCRRSTRHCSRPAARAKFPSKRKTPLPCSTWASAIEWAC